MKTLLIIAFALSTLAASARSIEIRNNDSRSRIKIELAADFGNGVQTLEKYLFPTMRFSAGFDGHLDLKITSQSEYELCQGMDYNSFEDVLVKVNADWTCSVSSL